MRTFFRLSTLAFGIAVVATAQWSARGEDIVDIPLADCPAAVQKTIREESRGGTIESVSKETEDGMTSYWADVVIDGKPYEIGVTADGMLTEISMLVDNHEIGLTDCPAAVQKTFRAEAGTAKIRDVRRESDLGVTIYSTEVEISGKRYKVMVAEDGTLTEKILLIDENKVPIDDCPTAVQKALKDESKGGTLKDIFRSSGFGKWVFMAAYESRGNRFNLVLFEDGSLISKTRDEP